MIHIVDDNIDEVVKYNNIVVVDFWATWRGSCRAMSMFIDKLEKESDRITFCKANVEESEKITERLNVQNQSSVYCLL